MSQIETISSFVEGAPPGEVSQPLRLSVSFIPVTDTSTKLADVVAGYLHSAKEMFRAGLTARTCTDIKALTISGPSVVSKLGPAFEKYNEEQFATVKLPGGSQPVR
jgi:capping protein (actin filament) muscle Z-line, alpha